MNYSVRFSKSVMKKILKYQKPTRDRIYKALNNLPHGDIKKLQGQNNPPFFRLRIGNMRALFVKDDYKMEIFVFGLETRGDIYK
ncbi:type II toxin-antitoxin system RelE family toxin [Desulfitibacter alkalitolerans]|uniref:type II toxin-antitoxin system RelE family toxin n=1 Tax=Desulfitibacter alkalitolerans TaxID=264641 RepID=UPI000487656C|nr:type II toxin-antitoxin system RelE/ParE family toxin [Desulfitibacter alkalitolerans]